LSVNHTGVIKCRTDVIVAAEISISRKRKSLSLLKLSRKLKGLITMSAVQAAVMLTVFLSNNYGRQHREAKKAARTTSRTNELNTPLINSLNLPSKVIISLPIILSSATSFDIGCGTIHG
jgi:hypothetical protein